MLLEFLLRRAARALDQLPPPRVDFYVSEAAGADARLRLACRVAEKAYLAKQTCRRAARRRRSRCAVSTRCSGPSATARFVPHDAVTRRRRL